MKKQKGFWADMFSGANGVVSSKRVLGSFILVVLLVVIVINTFWGAENHWLGEAFITMLIGAFSLLGIGVFEKQFPTLDESRKRIKEEREEEKKKDYTLIEHDEYIDEERDE